MFFFFQAEDGIRDLIVTGVQTCALPISVYCLLLHHSSFRIHHSSFLLAEGVGVEPTGALVLRQFSGLLGVPVPNLPSCWQGRSDLNRERRSEERRVGKECRSRWSPYH